MSDRSMGVGQRVLERMLARFRRRRERSEAMLPLSASAFRAVVNERLRNVERQLHEVKGRVNGLIFLLTGAVAAQFVLRLLV